MPPKRPKRPKKPLRPISNNFTPGEFNKILPIVKFVKDSSGFTCENRSLSNCHDNNMFAGYFDSPNNIYNYNEQNNTNHKIIKLKKIFYTHCKLLTSVDFLFFRGKIVNRHLLNKTIDFIKKNDNSSFRKGDVTYGLRNSIFNSEDIDSILEYLCYKGIVVKGEELDVKSLGRPKSQLYKSVT